MTGKFYIQSREISDKKPPLIIGEVSANHDRSLNKIYRLIDCAAEINLEAIKFQTFDINEMTFDINKNEFLLKKYFQNKKWNNRSLFNLYSEAYLPHEWHSKIFKRAEKKGIICFSSVFDLKSLNLLKNLNCPAYKIASLESQHFPLIEQVIKIGKPIIISTGTLNLKEIKEVNGFFLKKKFTKFAILHCLTQYPAKIDNCNLKTITYMKKKFNSPIGFSDHTTNSTAALAAIALGSNIIEKHFMISEKENTLDSNFSFSPKKMEKLIKDSVEVWKSMGTEKKKITNEEKFYKKFRRSIYVSKNLQIGDKIDKDSIKIIRPGYGIEPKFYKKILGKKVKRSLSRGEPLKLSDLY